MDNLTPSFQVLAGPHFPQGIVGDIVFNAGGTELIKLAADGKFYYRGELVEESPRMADAFVSLSKLINPGGYAPCIMCGSHGEEDVSNIRRVNEIYVNRLTPDVGNKPRLVKIVPVNSNADVGDYEFLISGRPPGSHEKLRLNVYIVYPGFTYAYCLKNGGTPIDFKWYESQYKVPC